MYPKQLLRAGSLVKMLPTGIGNVLHGTVQATTYQMTFMFNVHVTSELSLKKWLS